MKLLQRVRHIADVLRNRQCYAAYRRFKDYTMIPRSAYIANLKLVRNGATIPGAIVECGTWKGGMIAGIASLLGPDREYYLFDSFEGLPPVEAIDGPAAKRWQENTTAPGYRDNCTASEIDATAAMALAGVPHAKLVKGWFEKTLPQAAFPTGIALLRMDADWYKSTAQILTSLFPAVNEGGLILIDDYYTWDGCSRAVHDYLSAHKRPERIASYRGVCFIKKRRDEEVNAAAGSDR